MHTRFCFASTYPIKQAEFIYSLTHYAKGTPHKFHDLFDCLDVLNFRIFFTPFSRVLFTFPSRYLFTIGLNNIFRQRRWASFYSNNLICFTSIFKTLSKNTGLSPSLVKDPTLFCLLEFLVCLFRFLSPILTESRLISFPKGT